MSLKDAIDPIEHNTALFSEWHLAFEYRMPLSQYLRSLSADERRLNLYAYSLLKLKERYANLTVEQRNTEWPP